MKEQNNIKRIREKNIQLNSKQKTQLYIETTSKKKLKKNKTTKKGKKKIAALHNYKSEILNNI